MSTAGVGYDMTLRCLPAANIKSALEIIGISALTRKINVGYMFIRKSYPNMLNTANDLKIPTGWKSR